MSRDLKTDTRWHWRAGTAGSHMIPNNIDEIEAERRHISHFKSKNSDTHKTEYLAEKLSNLKVDNEEEFDLKLNLAEFESEILKPSETFTNISVTGSGHSACQPRCTASQSLCQMPRNISHRCYESSPYEGKFPNFASFPDKLNTTTDPGAMATESSVCDDAMDDVMSDTSWNPAVLRRISSPRLSRETFSNPDDRISGDFRYPPSDSDSLSRVSFLLDENHVTHGHRNRKTQSMTNFLDLNSDVVSYSEEGELNMSCNNSSDVAPDCQTAMGIPDGRSSSCGLSLSESDLDVTSTSLTYHADVSDNVTSDDVMTPYLHQTQSPQSPDSMLDTPSEVKALTHNSLGRHDGDVIKDYQRSKSLDALRKRKRGRVAAFRQSAISVANHVIGVFKRVKDTDGENRSTGKHGSPKKRKESRRLELGPGEQLFNFKNTSVISSTSSSEYEIN